MTNMRINATILVVIIGAVYFATAPDDEGVRAKHMSSTTGSKAEMVAAAAEKLKEGVWEFDASRIYDLNYVNDQGLIALAAKANRSPTCLLELIHNVVEGVEEPFPVSEQCQAEGRAIQAADRTRHDERLVVIDNLFTTLSDDELRALSYTTAQAAIVLAERLPDNAESEALFEHAAILSGKPGPLGRWAYRENKAGIEYPDGALDIEMASLAYEIAFVSERMGFYSAADKTAERLEAAGVDLTPIEQRATTRFNRLTVARMAVVGQGWRN